MTCIKIPNGILCVGTPMIRLGEHRFEMHPYMGPVKLRKDGEVAVTDFHKSFWPLFERWMDNGQKVDKAGLGI